MQRARAYALAVVNLCTDRNLSTVDAVASALLNTLRTKGEIRLLPKIVRAVSKELEHNGKINTTTLTVARAADERVIREFLSTESSTKDLVINHVCVDDRLVGGFTLGNANSYSDSSYRTKLIKLFNSLV